MNYLDELRLAEKWLKETEQSFLNGIDGVTEALMERLASGTFSSDVKKARELVQKLDESQHIKWNRWERKYDFVMSSWKETGYPSIDTTTRRASNPDWYSKRTETTNFVKELIAHRSIVVPTIERDRKGQPTPKGAPSNKWLLDFVVLCSLRLSFKQHWEQLVRDIVRKQAKTDLNLVAEKLGLSIHDVLAIARKIRDLDDRVVEFDVTDPANNLTYYCRNPDTN